MLARCHCRECRAGDALPVELQGIPGAWQPLLIASIEGKEINMSERNTRICRDCLKAEQCRSMHCGMADSLPMVEARDGLRIRVETKALKAACSERCAEVGDQPCYDVVNDCAWPEDKPREIWTACDECNAECGIEMPYMVDPNAVVRPLL